MKNKEHNNDDNLESINIQKQSLRINKWILIIMLISLIIPYMPFLKTELSKLSLTLVLPIKTLQLLAGLIVFVVISLYLSILCIIKKNKKQNSPPIDKKYTQSSSPKLLPEVDPEIETRLILYSSINKKISIFPLKATLDPTNPIKFILKLLLASYYGQPNKKHFEKFSNDINEYNILDVSNKSWIEPKYANELNNKLIAFVPASSEGFEYLKISSKAKAISFAIESCLK